MTKKIEPYDVLEIARNIENSKNLLEILQNEIENLDGKRSSNAYTANEIMNEVERVTPHMLALCDVLLSGSKDNHAQLTKLVNDAIHEDK